MRLHHVLDKVGNVAKEQQTISKANGNSTLCGIKTNCKLELTVTHLATQLLLLPVMCSSCGLPHSRCAAPWEAVFQRRGGGPRITSIVWFLVVWKDEVPYRGVIPVWKGKASEYRALPDCSSALKCLHTVSTGSIRIWSQWKCIPGACCFGVSWWIQTKSPCGLCPDAGPAAPSLPRMVQGHQPALWHTALTCTSGMNSAATSPPMLPTKENSPRFLDKGFSPSIRAMW